MTVIISLDVLRRKHWYRQPVLRLECVLGGNSYMLPGRCYGKQQMLRRTAFRAKWPGSSHSSRIVVRHCRSSPSWKHSCWFRLLLLNDTSDVIINGWKRCRCNWIWVAGNMDVSFREVTRNAYYHYFRKSISDFNYLFIVEYCIRKYFSSSEYYYHANIVFLSGENRCG